MMQDKTYGAVLNAKNNILPSSPKYIAAKDDTIPGPIALNTRYDTFLSVRINTTCVTLTYRQ